MQNWLIFQNDNLLLAESSKDKVLSQSHLALFNTPLAHEHHIGTVDGTEIYCANIPPEAPLPPGLTAIPLRKALDLLGNRWYNHASKAFAIINWDINHHYCGRCGHLTKAKPTTFERTCSACGLAFYPRISPSVIVLINKGDEILMARSPHFTPGVFALIAGFVEAGENVEDAVHREVQEEVGISIKNLTYFGSQPWPFPDSLMFGFTAEYNEGELVINHEEIEMAGWYHYDKLPGRPSNRTSLAHKLLEHFIASKRS